jgi:hypothetical protein
MKTREIMSHQQVSSTQSYLESILDDADLDDLILKAA